TPKPGAQPGLTARGFWAGFRVRCPQLPERAALTVNGTNAPYRKEGDYVVYGDISKTPESSRQIPGVASSDESALSPNRSSESIRPLQSLEILALKDPIRLAVQGSRQVTLELRNGSAVPQRARVRLGLPGGVLAEPSDVSAVTREERSTRASTFS